MINKNQIIQYLNSNSESNQSKYYKIYNNYISVLRDLIRMFPNINNPSKDKQFNQSFSSWIRNAIQLQAPFVPYSRISNAIYSISYNDKEITSDSINELCTILNRMLKQYIQNHYSEKDICGYSILIKTIEYMKLSTKQVDYLYSKQEKELKGTTKKLQEFPIDLSSIKIDINNIRKSKEDIYSSFIAILGIFATIITSMFGGLSAISNSIRALSSKYANICNILLMVCVFSILLIFLIFFLFICIARLSGKDLVKRNKNSNHWFSKYPLFYGSIFYLSIITIIILIVKKICKI